MRIPFRIVDVFTDRPLAGNQLCVIPGPIQLSAEHMQAIALEIGFSETTFVTHAGGDRYVMRIFTPAVELPFAGHPSIGTVFVLVSEERVSSPATQVVEAGEVAVSADLAAGTARMRHFPPVFGVRVEDRQALADAVGLEPSDLYPDLTAQLVSTGFGQLMLPVRDAGAVVRARPVPPTLDPLLAAAGTDGVYVFAVTGTGPEGATVKARFFGAGVGIVEDAATGAAAGPCGAYLVEHGVIPAGRILITQGVEMGRPSTLVLDVDASPDGELTVYLSGGVVKVGEGVLDLPL